MTLSWVQFKFHQYFFGLFVGDLTHGSPLLEDQVFKMNWVQHIHVTKLNLFGMRDL